MASSDVLAGRCWEFPVCPDIQPGNRHLQEGQEKDSVSWEQNWDVPGGADHRAAAGCLCLTLSECQAPEKASNSSLS